MRLPKPLPQLAEKLAARRQVAAGRRLLRRVVEEVRLRDPVVYQSLHGPSREPGGAPQQVHYVGRARFASDLMALFAREQDDRNIEVRLHRGRGWWDLVRRPAAAQALPKGADVWVVDRLVGSGARRGAATFVPFVEASLAVADSMEGQLGQLRSRGHRRKLQSAIKRGISWRHSRSPADFELFYDQMYAPFVAERFAFDRSVVSRQDMLRVFERKGFLLLCEEEGEPVSGAMMYVSPEAPKTIAYWKYGLRDSAQLSPAAFGERNARTEAMVLQYAVAERYGRIDFGLTRGLTDDGIFAHKKRLGCDFVPPKDPPARFDLSLPQPRCASLLAATPMLVVQGGRLAGWAGHVGPGDDASIERLAEQLHGMHFPSLGGISVFVANASLPTLARLGELAVSFGQQAGGLQVHIRPHLA